MSGKWLKISDCRNVCVAVSIATYMYVYMHLPVQNSVFSYRLEADQAEETSEIYKIANTYQNTFIHINDIIIIYKKEIKNKINNNNENEITNKAIHAIGC